MQSLYSGLVGYWDLHDASGSRLDLSGNGSTLTNVNTVTSVDGLVGAASNFVLASSQKLTAASSAVLQGGAKSYTWACWVQLATKPASQFTFISKLSAVSGQSEYWLRWSGSSADIFQFSVYTATDSGKNAQAIAFGAPSTATWYFLRGWYDHTAQTVNIQVNDSDPASTAMGAPAQAASAAGLSVGADYAGDYTNGKMCEMGKWDRVLTTQEHLWLYNKGRGRTYPFDGRYSVELGRHSRSRRAQRSL